MVFVNGSVFPIIVDNIKILQPGDKTWETPTLITIEKERGYFSDGKYNIVRYSEMYIVVLGSVKLVDINYRGECRSVHKEIDGHKGFIYTELSECCYVLVRLDIGTLIFADKNTKLSIIQYQHRYKCVFGDDKITFGGREITFDDKKVQQIPDHKIISLSLDFRFRHIEIRPIIDKRTADIALEIETERGL